MPRNTREWAHRKIDQAITNMDWSLYHIEEIDQKYKVLHPEISEVLIMGQTLIVQCQDLLRKLAQSF